MSDFIPELDGVWRVLWQVLGSYESWRSDEAKCKDIQQRLSHFNRTHSANPDDIDDVIEALSKGFHLTKSGLQWHEPTVGHSKDVELNTTHKARGAQWRLVITWGGFETITKTLLKQRRGGLKPETIEDIIHKSDLPNYSSLLPPNSKLASLDRWLKKPAPIGKKSALASFLSLESGDETIVQQWLVQASSIHTWPDAVRLAKALRNATSHGALSATKVKQWGLEDALLTLSNNLGEIVVASVKKLT